MVGDIVLIGVSLCVGTVAGIVIMLIRAEMHCSSPDTQYDQNYGDSDD